MRSQYSEFLLFLAVRLDEERMFYCPYIYVDADSAMVRGWLLGYPKKLGTVHVTRSFPLTSAAAPAVGPGGRFGGTLALHGRRLAEAVVTLQEPAEPVPPVFGSRPIVARRHFASLYRGELNRPAVDELTRLSSEGNQISPVWCGLAALTFFPSPTEDLDRLGPLRVLRGYRYSVAMTNQHNVKVKDLKEAT